MLEGLDKGICALRAVASIVLATFLFPSSSVAQEQNPAERDIVILVDVSGSVYEPISHNARDLIIDLIEGSYQSTKYPIWRSVDEEPLKTGVLDYLIGDAYERSHSRLPAHLARALDGDGDGTALTGRGRTVMIIPFGNRDRLEPYGNQPSNSRLIEAYPRGLRDAVRELYPANDAGQRGEPFYKDGHTYLNLALAHAARRMHDATRYDGYYLFVVSDGVDDSLLRQDDERFIREWGPDSGKSTAGAHLAILSCDVDRYLQGRGLSEKPGGTDQFYIFMLAVGFNPREKTEVDEEIRLLGGLEATSTNEQARKLFRGEPPLIAWRSTPRFPGYRLLVDQMDGNLRLIETTQEPRSSLRDLRYRDEKDKALSRFDGPLPPGDYDIQIMPQEAVTPRKLARIRIESGHNLLVWAAVGLGLASLVLLAYALATLKQRQLGRRSARDPYS